MSAGLVKLGHVALDGIKMKANASKHKAMSYDRLVADDAKLRAEVEGLLQRAEEVEAEEDEREPSSARFERAAFRSSHSAAS